MCYHAFPGRSTTSRHVQEWRKVGVEKGTAPSLHKEMGMIVWVGGPTPGIRSSGWSCKIVGSTCFLFFLIYNLCYTMRTVYVLRFLPVMYNISIYS